MRYFKLWRSRHKQFMHENAALQEVVACAREEMLAEDSQNGKERGRVRQGVKDREGGGGAEEEK